MEAYARAFMSLSTGSRHDLMRRIQVLAGGTGLEQLFTHFSAPLKSFEDCLKAGQSAAFTSMETNWAIGHWRPGDGFCARTKAVLTNVFQAEIPPTVQHYFGITHRPHWTCASGHSQTAPAITVPEAIVYGPDLVHLNHVHPEQESPTLEQLLTFMVPRRSGKSVPLHRSPNLTCARSSCKLPSSVTSVTTHYPLFLRVRPLYDSATSADVQIPRDVSWSREMRIQDIEYQLVAVVKFIPGVDGNLGHYTAKLRVKNKTYLYDDTKDGGRLHYLGALDVLEQHDDQVSYLLFTRQTKSFLRTWNLEELEHNSQLIRIPSPVPVMVIPDTPDAPPHAELDAKGEDYPEPPSKISAMSLSPPRLKSPSPDLSQNSSIPESEVTMDLHCEGCQTKMADTRGNEPHVHTQP
ncbi:unnamed protein product [Mycena citricolor]|uniref:USP domain-containing protein n=1 Tax=Mycena citricolor TaxID=2018698 RepID=A0AAD2HRI5_9AGAR|nr:unnamed protein product [Mycena citricolor]